MGTIGEISTLLEKIPLWKRLKALPQEVEALRARVDALEARLAPASGAVCPKCRAPQFTLVDSRPEPGPFAQMGARQYTYRCSACSYEDVGDRER